MSEDKLFAVRYPSLRGWRYFDGHGDTSDPKAARPLSEEAARNVINNIFVIENREGVAVPFGE